MHYRTSLLRWPLLVLLAFALTVFAGDRASMVVSAPGKADVVIIDAMAESGKLELPGVIFRHERHSEALRMAQKDCASCHKPSDAMDRKYSFAFMGSEKLTGAALKDLYHDKCISCHNETRKAGRFTGPLTAQCRTCHVSGLEKSAAQKSKQGRGRALHGPDLGGAGGASPPSKWTDATHDRHIASRRTTAPGQDENCAACHHVYNAEKKTLVHESSAEDSCKACHLTPAKQKAALAANPQAADASGLIAHRLTLDRASHQACVNCHLVLAAKAPKADNGPVDCSGCHVATALAAQTAEPAQTGAFRASLYAFLTGPAFVISLLVFFGGLICRIAWYFKGLDWKLDRVGYRPNMSLGMQGGLHSIVKWLLPYGTHGWRSHPVCALGFLLLHAGAVLVPLFLIGHNLILQHNFGFSLPTMPQSLADVLSVLALIGISMLALRRVVLSEARILTTWHDCFVLALVFLSFITGFVARLHVGNYDFWLICHILFGELMLILAPFTKLSHMALFFGSRWQTGADFGIKRGGRNRGVCFPW